MAETMLRYALDAGPLGASLELGTIEALTGDPGALDDLRAALNERAVVRIAIAKPIEPEQFIPLQRFLGEPESRRTGASVVAGTDFLGNFSAKGRPDDGRPRTPGFIESLHGDTMPNGPAAYGIHYSRLAPPTVPMRFVDMRAVYAALPQAMQDKLAGLRTRHTSRARPDGKPSPWTMQPLAIKHPLSGAPLLLLPNRRDARVEGLPDDEGSALIAELWRLTETAAVQLAVPLRTNTLVIWDNILCVHDNPAFPRDQDRITWFFNALNTAPIEALAA